MHDEAADGLQSRSGRIKQTKDKDVVDDDDDEEEEEEEEEDDDVVVAVVAVVVVVVTYLFTNILVPT